MQWRLKMTAVINGVIVTGTPEEIKALIDMYNPPKHYSTAGYGEGVKSDEGDVRPVRRNKTGS